MRKISLAVFIFALAATASAGEKVNPKLQDIRAIFVAGNNQAAESARDELLKGKSCFTLASKESEADAVLAIDTDTKSVGGALGAFGTRDWIASGTLTLRSGDLVWSRSGRFGDAPFSSGGKVAGRLLVKQLVRESGCKK